MDALLMCGGRGTRLESETEKPLVQIGGEPMVDRVRDALATSEIETAYAVVSPNAPETRAHLSGMERIETPGEGYVADLSSALECELVDPPVLTVVADLPLLEGAVIDRILEAYRSRAPTRARTEVEDGRDEYPSCTVCVPTALKRRLGASRDTTLESDAHLAPTGVNVVGGGVRGTGTETETRTQRQMTHLSYDHRLAINVNRPTDVRRAEELCTREVDE